MCLFTGGAGDGCLNKYNNTAAAAAALLLLLLLLLPLLQQLLLMLMLLLLLLMLSPIFLARVTRSFTFVLNININIE